MPKSFLLRVVGGSLALVCMCIGLTVWSLVRVHHARNQPAAENNPRLTNASTTDPFGPQAFRTQVMAEGLRAPWAVGFLPDGRALVTERIGRVRLIDGNGLVDTPVLRLGPEDGFHADTKNGLLGLAIHPGFNQDDGSQRFVYLAQGQTWDTDGQREQGVQLVRYRMTEGDRLVEPHTLIDRIPGAWNHCGGRLAFGPDGKLYMTTGDGDRPPLAQDLRSLAGKILRFNADGSIPDDNPFASADDRIGAFADAHPAIYSFGHRNPQGLAFHPTTGQLWSTEHGPNGGDEINQVQPGVNHGWPVISHNRTHEGMAAPVVQFSPSIAPASAAFCTGPMFQHMQGDLLVGCLRGEGILRARIDDQGNITRTQRLLYTRFGRIRDVVLAPDGAIWLTTSMFDPPEAHAKPATTKSSA